MGKFCYVFGKTRQAWYYATNHSLGQTISDSLVVKLVKAIREEQPRIGTRKLYNLLSPHLNAHGIKMGRDKLFDLLERYDLLIHSRRRRAITTDSNHPYYKYDNLIQNLSLTAKNQLWVSDITYISTRAGFAYLSLVTDAFSRKIVGYCLLDNLSAKGPIAALDKALEEQNPNRYNLIHHSDRGVQYCCNDYTERLSTWRIRISMSHKGDPYQNAIAERINGILKTEFGLDKIFENIEEARQVLDKAVKVYNSKRPHSSLSYLTPDQAHELSGMIKRNWKNYQKTTCTQNQDLALTT